MKWEQFYGNMKEIDGAEFLRKFREALENTIFKPPIKGDKMQGNQSLGMIKSDWILSKALDYHFSENCCGTLEFDSIDCKIFDHADLIKFKCQHCKRIITIVQPN